MQANGICCHPFRPSKEMVNNFNSNQMYGPRRRNNREAPASNETEADVDEPDAVQVVEEEVEVISILTYLKFYFCHQTAHY